MRIEHLNKQGEVAEEFHIDAVILFIGLWNLAIAFIFSLFGLVPLWLCVASYIGGVLVLPLAIKKVD